LPWTQVFEQHSLPAVQAFPDVSQLVFRATHSPLLHFPPQHWPSALHFWSSEMQASAHLSFWQLKPQQSVAEWQASFVAAQVVSAEAQVLLFVSQTPAQQSRPPRQGSP